MRRARLSAVGAGTDIRQCRPRGRLNAARGEEVEAVNLRDLVRESLDWLGGCHLRSLDQRASAIPRFVPAFRPAILQ